MTLPGALAEGFIIPATTGRAFEIKKGQTFRIHQVNGQQVGDCVFYNAHDYREMFHVGQSGRSMSSAVPAQRKASGTSTPSRPAKMS